MSKPNRIGYRDYDSWKCDEPEPSTYDGKSEPPRPNAWLEKWKREHGWDVSLLSRRPK